MWNYVSAHWISPVRPWSPLHSRFTSFSKSARSATSRTRRSAGIALNLLPTPTSGGPSRLAAPRSSSVLRGLGRAEWWRRRDSNPRPPGCKPGALPAELRPRASTVSPATDQGRPVVGLTGLEPETSRLSGGRSNQLSYSPGCPARKRSKAKQSVRMHHRASRAPCLDARLPSRGGVRLVGRKGGPRSCTCSLCSTPWPPARANGQGSNMIPLERR